MVGGYDQHACAVCKKMVWRTGAELSAVGGDVDALAPGAMCGSCRTGARPVVAECRVCFAIEPLIHFSHPRRSASCAHHFCCGCWVAQVEVAVKEARMEVCARGASQPSHRALP
jgi:hypothetical protein